MLPVIVASICLLALKLKQLICDLPQIGSVLLVVLSERGDRVELVLGKAFVQNVT